MKQLTALLLLVLLSAACGKDSTGLDSIASNGQSGSITRFAMYNGYMYTLNLNEVVTYSLENPDQPRIVNHLPTDYGLETIFVYDNTVYLGSSTSLYILDISNPAAPTILSKTDRIAFFAGGCDPVVVKDNYAYATIKIVQNRCGIASSQSALLVYDVSNKTAPDQIGTYFMNIPEGLGYKDNYLFVCDEGANRLQVFDISNPLNLTLLDTAAVSILNPVDLIVNGDKMIVSTKKDFQIFDVSQAPTIKRISLIAK